MDDASTRLRMGRLPRLWPVERIALMQRVMATPYADLDALISLAAHDATLTARLISMAGSAMFAHRPPPTSLRQAVVAMGGMITRGMLISVILHEGVENRCPALDTARLWRESLTLAYSALALASRAPHVRRAADRDIAYCAGLLHRIGLLALGQAYPDDMARLLTAETDPPLSARLCATFGMDHHDAATTLFQGWHMPPVYAVLQHTLDQPETAGEYQHLAELLATARDWCDANLDVSEATLRPLSERIGYPEAEWPQLVESVGAIRAALESA